MVGKKGGDCLLPDFLCICFPKSGSPLVPVVVVIKNRVWEWGNLELILYLVAKWLFSDSLICLKWGGQQDSPHRAALRIT